MECQSVSPMTMLGPPTFRIARHPDMIDARSMKSSEKKINVKIKLQDCLVPVFFVADLPPPKG